MRKSGLRGYSARLLRLALFCLLSGTTLHASAQAGEATPLENQVKAAFIFKFTAYIDWPEAAFPHPETPLTIGVIGDNQVATELTKLVAGRTLEGRPFEVRRLKATDVPTNVHILFAGRSESARLLQIIKAASTSPTLIVTESPGALDQGSMINFVVAGGRVRFDVALDEAERRSLKISSRLLTVAQNVRGIKTP